MPTIDEIKVVVDAEISKYNAKFDEALQKIDKFGQDVQKRASATGNVLEGIQSKLIAAFAVDKLIDVGKQIFAVTAQFEKFSAVLTNSLGSNTAAQIAMQKIQDFAQKTPFSVQEVTESFVQLANRGIQATTTQLQGIGDVAATLGKPLQQVNEAILDVSNSERWTELGIKVTSAGNKMSGTFRGVTIEVAKTEAGALSMIEQFGQLDGVAGAMAVQMDTLNGVWSNFKDALDQLFVTMGNGVSGPFKSMLGALTDYVTWVKNGLKSTQDFNNELANTRADKFIQNFKGLAAPDRESQESSVRADIQLQTSLIRQLEDERTRLRLVRGSGEKLEQIDLQKNQLTLALQTNEKRMELIRALYAEEGKLADITQKGLLEAARENVKSLKAEMEKAGSEATLAQIESRLKDGEKLVARLEALAGPQTRVGGVSTQNNVGRLTTGKTFESNQEGLVQPMQQALETMQQYRDRIANIQLIDPDKLVPKNRIDAVVERFKTLGQGGEREISKLEESINSSLNSGVATALSNFADLVGNVASGTVSGFEGIFNGIMSIVADFLGQFGKSLIAAGVAAIAFESLIENPYAAIAAGAALLIAASAVKSTLSKGLSGSGTAGGSGGGTSQRGGIGAGQLNINGEFVIRGSDLVYILGKGQAQQKRVGG